MSLMEGRADGEGTSLYAKRFSASAAGHFRTLDKLTVSSIGIGTYLGPATDEVDEQYTNAVFRALSLGIDVLDTAINYRNMLSERSVGRALSQAVSQKMLKRNEVVVCTKGGYVGFDGIRPLDVSSWLEETFVKPGICSLDDFAGTHCMAPRFIKDQFEKSRKNLGLECIDVYYVHNPETQLAADVPPEEFYARIRDVFVVLEEECKQGRLTMYGTATWNGFRIEPDMKGHLSLEDLTRAAYEAGGKNHHFKIIQAPFNLGMQELADKETQIVQGRRMTLLNAAKQLGVSVVASASLMQTRIFKDLPEDACQTNAQHALQFVRTTPNIMTALVGMRSVAHVEENAAVIKLSSHARSSSS